MERTSMHDTAGRALVEEEFDRLRKVYEEQAMGKVIGYGERPAVVCVDLVKGFTDPRATWRSTPSSSPAPRRADACVRRRSTPSSTGFASLWCATPSATVS
jgi:hypothetical protein